MKKLAVLLSLLSLSSIKSADQVFKGNSPGVAGRIACSDAADDAQWFSPISTNCGVAVSSNTPTATGNVLCATGTVTAQFESPSACGLATGTNLWTLSGGNILSSPAGDPVVVDTTGSSTTTPAEIGALNLAAGQAVRVPIGDVGSALQVAYGDQLQIYAYHGIQIAAARGTLTPPSFVAGGGAADALTLAGGTGGVVVNSPLHIGSSGTAISGSPRTTVTNPALTVSAQSCNNSSAITLTGGAQGAECSFGTNNVSVGNLSCTCFMGLANNAFIHCCNPTTGSLSLPAGTYSLRAWNP